MSNSKRSPYFYSPLKVESDQKELIIGHLQDEIYILKRNEQELIKLEDQYRNLEHRFRLLSEEKVHRPTPRPTQTQTSKKDTI